MIFTDNSNIIQLVTNVQPFFVYFKIVLATDWGFVIIKSMKPRAIINQSQINVISPTRI